MAQGERELGTHRRGRDRASGLCYRAVPIREACARRSRTGKTEEVKPTTLGNGRSELTHLHERNREAVRVLKHRACDCTVRSVRFLSAHPSTRKKYALAKFFWPGLSRNAVPRTQATAALKDVRKTKPTGMIARSLSLSGEREKATLEKRRAGVKSETLIRFRVYGWENAE